MAPDVSNPVGLYVPLLEINLSIAYVEKLRTKSFVCRLGELYREDLSQRFAGYLARIGLPEPTMPTVPQLVISAST